METSGLNDLKPYYSSEAFTNVNIIADAGSRVSIIHFPGHSKNINVEVMDHICRSIVTTDFIPSEHKYTIATVVTDDNYIHSPLIYQLERNNIEFINLGYGHSGKNWKRLNKPEIINNGLSNINTPYTLLLDGNDVAIAGYLTDYVKYLKEYNCQILCNATISRFPDVEVETIPDRLIKYGEWQYLNAGVMFGKTDLIKQLYRYIIDNSKINPVDSEQYYVRQFWSENPELIQIDYLRKIFAIINRYTFKGLDWKQYIH